MDKLAEEVEAYILENEDSVAQEERWRTTMMQKMSLKITKSEMSLMHMT